MASLDEALAQRAGSNLTFNNQASKTAQQRLGRKFRMSIWAFGLAAIIVLIAQLTGYSNGKISDGLCIYTICYLALCAVWYGFLLTRLNKIDIANATPVQTIRAAGQLKLLTFSGETVIMIGLAVMVTVFLHTVGIHDLRFWIVTVGLVLVIVFQVIWYARFLRDFRSLTTLD